MPDKEVKEIKHRQRRKKPVNVPLATPEAIVNTPEPAAVKPPVVEQVPVTPPIVQAPVVTTKSHWWSKKKDASVKVKKVGGRRWWLLGLGVGILALGLVGIVTYAMSTNIAIGSVSVIALFGGGFAVYFGMQVRDEGIVLTASGKNIKPSEANAFNIYKDRLAFELMPVESLQGQPRKCRNDGKYYYVHTTWDAWRGKDTDANKLIAFTLPDTQYRNPTEFANNLNIPAHRELAKRRSTLFQKLSPALILVGMFIVFVLWVATSPAPSATASVIEQSTHPVQVGGK